MPDDPDYTDLLDRQEELRLWLAAHVPGPKVKLPAGLKVEGDADWWKHTLRGFPRFLEFGAHNLPGTKPIRALAAALPKAFAKLPTRWLILSSVTAEQLAELLKHPAVAGLDRLTVSPRVSEEPQDEMCRAIADCPHLRHLRGLTLFFPFGEIGAAALAGSAHLARLDRLRVEQCTPAAIHVLGSTDWFRGLRELHLSELPDAAFEELCRLDPFPNLHTLELNEASFPTVAWRAFARSKTFPRLTRLENRTEMTAGQVEALAGATGLRLVDLNLSMAAIGNDGAKALARAPWLGSLRRLSLSFNGLTASGFAAIAGSRKLTALKYLDLSHNAPGVAGLRALAGNPALRKLTALLLRLSSDDARGWGPGPAREFLSKLDMPYLRNLDLRNCRIGSKAARLLTGEPFASLTRLDLGFCKLTDAAASALFAAPALQNLIELKLTGNDLTPRVERLATRMRRSSPSRPPARGSC